MVDLPWEDNLLERKVESDLKDLLATLVAFANSVRPDQTAVLLIGEKDDGTVQGVTNADSIQKSVQKECEKIYPPIQCTSKVYEQKGKYCVRVEIEYDGDTPHFGGPAWVRKGSQTVQATDEIFQKLIDLRSNLVRKLALSTGKEISLSYQRLSGELGSGAKRWLRDVNASYATFEDIKNDKSSEPLDRLLLSYDHTKKRPMVIVKHPQAQS